MIKKPLVKWLFSGLIVCAALAGSLAGFSYYKRTAPLNDYVTEDRCKNLSNPSHCYSGVMAEVFEKAGFETALAYVKAVAVGKNYDTCHFLMHEIGRFAYREDHDIQRILARPDYFYCLGGFTHGALAEYLADSKNLEKDIAEVCAPFLKNGPVDQRGRDCIHGLGHSLMSVTENDIFKSVKYCDLYSEKMGRWHCHYGAFMENYYEHKSDYHGGPVKFIDRNDPLYPCRIVEEKYKPACYRFSGYIAITEYEKSKPKADWDIADFRVAIAACEKIDEGKQTDLYQKLCVGNLPAMIQGTYEYPENFAKVRQLCALANKESHEARCLAVFALVLSRIDYENRNLASRFCQEAEPRFRISCFDLVKKEQELMKVNE